jgi:hypothetical protein
LSILRCFTCAFCFAYVASTSFALDTAVDAVHADFLWQQGYTGGGVEIGVIDLFMAQSSHPAISGNFLGSQKFVNGQSWVDNHATSVAGAALSQDPVRRGVAYGAGWWTAQTTNRGSITNSRNQTIAAETFARGLGDLNSNPAEVITMSIGFSGSDAATDQWSLGLDHIIAARGTIIVVAAGNDGPASGTLSGPPVGAFNILSVGATGGTNAAISDDYSHIAPYSSRGPTSDGRSKPDVVAPGSLLELPMLNNTWSEGSGTSFATPLVAGGAALLIDMGRDRGMNTDALVIKSVLMNSADKLAGWSHTSASPLDPNFGAGQMNLESAFHQYDSGEQDPGTVDVIGWDHGLIASGADSAYDIGLNLPAGSELTATLVWNRPVTSSTSSIETTVYTASPLANLDLFLYEVSNLSTPVASSISVVDNVEHLFLPIAAQGHYTIAVRDVSGALIDPLSYSLAWNVLVSEIAPPGDYNGDGSADAADYVVWRKNDGTPEGYDTWRAHFGQTAGSGSGASGNATVPEPAAMVMLIMVAAGWCVRRSRALEKVPSSH